MKLRVVIAAILGLVLTFPAFAAVPDPMVMLQKVSNQMLASLKKERPNLKKDSDLIYKLVDRIVIPHVDIEGMSRAVLGRAAWTKATPKEQADFTQAFKRAVVGTYASALNAYTDETIKFSPLREDYEHSTRLEIDSQVVRNDGPPISVSYRLALLNNEWHVYDLSVEGVSLLESFHAQFADALSQGKTIEQITSDLQKRKVETRGKNGN